MKNRKKQIKIFFETAYRTGDLVEIRPLPTKLGARRWIFSQNVDAIMDAMIRENQAGANLYAGMLPRKKIGEGNAASCLPGSVLWADFDSIEPQVAYDTAMALELPEPTLFTQSGHGAHLYWRLKEKVKPQEITALVAGLAGKLGSDPSVSDAARIMRIPGLRNWKPPIAEAKILKYTDNYHLADELRFALPVKRPKPERALLKPTSSEDVIDRARKYVAMIPGSGQGGRTTAAFKVAAALTRDFDLPDSDVIFLLRAWDTAANTPPIQTDPAYPDDELEKILMNAQRYGRHNSGEKRDSNRPVFQIRHPPRDAEEEKIIESMKAELDAQRCGKTVTIPLPWPALSRLSKALRPGSVTVLAGPIKSGKTFMAQNILLDADSSGISWAYLPLEDAKQDFIWRLLAVRTNNYAMIDDAPETVESRENAVKLFADEIRNWRKRVSENPRIGNKDKDGNTLIPVVGPGAITNWLRRATKSAKLVFVDPMSQIEFGRRAFEAEANFVRSTLALAKDSGSRVIILAHTVKRPGKNGTTAITAEDVQGSAMFTRLCQTVLLIEGHEPKETLVYSFGQKVAMMHNRTVLIGAARNGPGTRTRIAFQQGTDGPRFEEIGVVAPKKRS